MSDTGSTSQVLVAGGGIGGLAAALALARQGCNVKVLEQAARDSARSAPASSSAERLRAFDALGVGDTTRGRAVYTDEMVMHDALDE